ncbi:hypothetical protein Vi05172_g10150 [Venturia inaequalis]|nr:hypothetical protein Vi05172_g10150 [Venturia inaequalis]
MDRFLDDDDGVYNYIGCSKRYLLALLGDSGWNGVRHSRHALYITLVVCIRLRRWTQPGSSKDAMVKDFGEVAGYVEKARDSLASKFPGEMYRIRRMFF